MSLLEKNPDNTAIDALLRRNGVPSGAIPSLPILDPSGIDPMFWPVTENNAFGAGVVGRHKVMRYDFGAPRAITSAVYNQTSNPIKRTLTGTETIGTSTTMSISSTVEASFYSAVKVSVTTAFSQTWSSEKTFTDSLEVVIPPGRMMWLEVKPVMRILDGDFVHFVSFLGALADGGRFSGTVTAPGVEGSLRDVISAVEAPVSAELAESLLSVAKATPRGQGLNVQLDDDGVLTLPGYIGATLLRESAKREDVTEQVQPA